MAYDKALFFGIGMLVLIPVVMSMLGGSFGVNTAQVTQNETGEFFAETFGLAQEDEEQSTGFFAWIANFFGGIASAGIPFISAIAGFVEKTFLGYALFPWWFNIFITAIPTLLIIRGVFSV